MDTDMQMDVKSADANGINEDAFTCTVLKTNDREDHDNHNRHKDEVNLNMSVNMTSTSTAALALTDRRLTNSDNFKNQLLLRA